MRRPSALFILISVLACSWNGFNFNFYHFHRSNSVDAAVANEDLDSKVVFKSLRLTALPSEVAIQAESLRKHFQSIFRDEDPKSPCWNDALASLLHSACLDLQSHELRSKAALLLTHCHLIKTGRQGIDCLDSRIAYCIPLLDHQKSALFDGFFRDLETVCLSERAAMFEQSMQQAVSDLFVGSQHAAQFLQHFHQQSFHLLERLNISISLSEVLNTSAFGLHSKLNQIAADEAVRHDTLMKHGQALHDSLNLHLNLTNKLKRKLLQTHRLLKQSSRQLVNNTATLITTTTELHSNFQKLLSEYERMRLDLSQSRADLLKLADQQRDSFQTASSYLDDIVNKSTQTSRHLQNISEVMQSGTDLLRSFDPAQFRDLGHMAFSHFYSFLLSASILASTPSRTQQSRFYLIALVVLSSLGEQNLAPFMLNYFRLGIIIIAAILLMFFAINYRDWNVANHELLFHLVKRIHDRDTVDGLVDSTGIQLASPSPPQKPTPATRLTRRRRHYSMLTTAR